ncbi:MAG: EAL domain-containing protein [Sphingomicrobium sp.]
MPTRNGQSPERLSWRVLLWTAIAGLVFGLVGLGEPAEDALRVARNTLHTHQASGDIVLVEFDDQSLRKVGRWPWPRSHQAALVDKLSNAGARRIFFDLTFSGLSRPADDAAFAQSIRRSGRVTLAAKARFGPDAGAQQDDVPLAMFARNAQLGSISVIYNYQNAVWRVPYASRVRGHTVPSFSAQLGGRSGTVGENFIPDYSLDVASIPTFSAADVLSGTDFAGKLRGKDVILGVTSDAGNDKFYLPGTGKMGGVYLHIIGAESLKSGTPVDLGWIPAFLFGLAAALLSLILRGTRNQTIALASGAAVLLLGPVLTEMRMVMLDITPGLFVIMVISTALTWRRYRVRGLVNPVSNLPNLNALRADREGGRKAIVAARLLNYEGIVATLTPAGERQLVEQIVSRLNVGDSSRTLYQGDAGIFAWFESRGQPFGNHIDALHTLFRNPARVGGRPIDLAIAFGVEVGSGRSLSNRLASALVAADEAAHDGLKWKYHDPETLADASWKLSMLSQLDDAIDRGEVWVAYQPKIELATRQIIGAEALARWTHPDKGPIAASEFVAAAEAHDRIAKLTDFVLEKAIVAAAAINRNGGSFDMAVNLSARMLVDKGFTLRLSALLARHGLAPQHLTLELTETAALGGNGEGLDMITRLRDFGVRIAIDDYGTGLSTLEYLKKIPANEIKIDQSFVKGIADNRSDRVMVQSTIGLAHSLGRQVVAEGVEQQEILDLLIEMGCDIAQGFAIGRPMSLDSLGKRIAMERKRNAA